MAPGAPGAIDLDDQQCGRLLVGSPSGGLSRLLHSPDDGATMVLKGSEPLTQLAIVSVVAGIVVIAARAPLAIAPVASSTGIRWLIGSDARIRVAGGFFGVIGVAMILAANASDHDTAWVIRIGGWAWAVAAFMLVVAPSVYRGIAQRVLQDSLRMRALGAIGALFGAFVVYLGIGVY